MILRDEPFPMLYGVLHELEAVREMVAALPDPHPEWMHKAGEEIHARRCEVRRRVDLCQDVRRASRAVLVG
ncbi:MAG: hypothetical protein JWO74_2777 [Solirubrobacterales bacterium]|nr:hypothetical protein [Solirubrobacterales bacterium]